MCEKSSTVLYVAGHVGVECSKPNTTTVTVVEFVGELITFQGENIENTKMAWF